MFRLHERLQADTLFIGEFPLSLVLLSKDANYPWVILVPKREGIKEIYQLPEVDQQQLMRESSALAQAMEDQVAPDKLNIATIGNLVPQLHMHHVARFKSDSAWPGPVWGAVPPTSYNAQQQASILAGLQKALAGLLLPTS